MSDQKRLSSPRRRSNRQNTRRRHGHHSTAEGNILMNVFYRISDFFKRDPFGVLWVCLIFLAALIAKWWFVNPELVQGNNCVVCVVAVAVIVAAITSLLVTAFWIFWKDRAYIGIGFYFSAGALGILCAFIVKKFVHMIIGKLYYSGNLVWEEAKAGILLDDLVPHIAGLYLGCFVVYLAIRMALEKNVEQKTAVMSTSVILLGTSSLLLLLGIELY